MRAVTVYMRENQYKIAQSRTKGDRPIYHLSQRCHRLWKEGRGKASNVVEVSPGEVVALQLRRCTFCHPVAKPKAPKEPKAPELTSFQALHQTPDPAPTETWPMRVEVWKTSDGREFESQGAAAIHQLDLIYKRTNSIVGLDA